MSETEKLAIFGGQPVLLESTECSHWPLIRSDEAEGVATILGSETLIGSDSEQVVQLENEWCRYIDVPFCRAVGSGTAGLHMALWGAGVGPGDDVLVPAYSFMATALAVLHAGAAPVFVDVDAQSYNLNPALIEDRITPRTKALIVVHLAGLPADMDLITAIAARHGIAVIEDAAHAHGATYKGRKTGTLGDAASFSLNAAKNLPAGEAGLFTTPHRSYYDRADGLWLGVTVAAPRESEKYPSTTLGYNYRCAVVAAALAREQLKRLDELNGMRQANCERLAEQLSDIPGVIPPTVPQDRTHVYHMFRVRFEPGALGIEDVQPREFRAKVVAALAAEGVTCRAWMNWTLPELPVFARPAEFERSHPWRRTWPSDRTYSATDCPEARRVVEQTVLLPDAPIALGPQIIDRLAEGFRKVFSQIDEVMRLQLTDKLASGELASGEAIREELACISHHCS